MKFFRVILSSTALAMALPTPQSPSNNSPSQPQANTPPSSRDQSWQQRARDFMSSHANQISENFAPLMNSAQGPSWYGPGTMEVTPNQVQNPAQENSNPQARQEQEQANRRAELRRQAIEKDPKAVGRMTEAQARRAGLVANRDEFINMTYQARNAGLSSHWTRRILGTTAGGLLWKIGPQEQKPNPDHSKGQAKKQQTGAEAKPIDSGKFLERAANRLEAIKKAISDYMTSPSTAGMVANPIKYPNLFQKDPKQPNAPEGAVSDDSSTHSPPAMSLADSEYEAYLRKPSNHNSQEKQSTGSINRKLPVQ